MHKRDYLVKQFEEFSKVLAIFLGLKRDGKFSELSELINESVLKYTSTEIKYIEGLKDDGFIETLTDDKKLSDDQLKILADLVFEKGNYYSTIPSTENESHNCYKKSLLLYTFLISHATLNYSLDMHYKIEILRKMKY
ncbi:MAG: hypothetical protein H7141_14555 [Burkholderiales bacterium]|nr:hypothetical protein [Bacteroidia bacterium]